MSKNNLILIGFMGSGKSSVGKAYAQKCGKKLLDTDQLVEKKLGMRISEIFENQGEEFFRKMETQILKELLLTCENSVLSVGGGLPLREENQTLLRQLGTVVYLKVSAKTVLKRLRGDHSRPLLLGENKEEKIQSLLLQRDRHYENASNYCLVADDKGIDEVVIDLESIVPQSGQKWGEQ